MTSQRLSIFLLMCATSSLITACQPARVVDDMDHQNLDEFSVDLKAAQGATAIEATSPAQWCTGSAATQKGCVQFGKKKQGAVWLYLNKGQKNRSCQTPTKADWVITKVELSATGDPATGKGTFGVEQPDWLVNAFPGVDQETGTLYIENNLLKASRKALIINLNNHVGEELMTAYYQVTASSCDGLREPIKIDPSIQNTGK